MGKSCRRKRKGRKTNSYSFPHGRIILKLSPKKSAKENKVMNGSSNLEGIKSLASILSSIQTHGIGDINSLALAAKMHKRGSQQEHKRTKKKRKRGSNKHKPLLNNFYDERTLPKKGEPEINGRHAPLSARDTAGQVAEDQDALNLHEDDIAKPMDFL